MITERSEEIWWKYFYCQQKSIHLLHATSRIIRKSQISVTRSSNYQRSNEAAKMECSCMLDRYSMGNSGHVTWMEHEIFPYRERTTVGCHNHVHLTSLYSLYDAILLKTEIKTTDVFHKLLKFKWRFKTKFYEKIMDKWNMQEKESCTRLLFQMYNIRQLGETISQRTEPHSWQMSYPQWRRSPSEPHGHARFLKRL